MGKNLQTLLNPQQLDAVQTIQGPVLVLAGAGTGKTRVITYRIANMISSGIPPESILAVTFTNKAAKEMLERLKDLLGKKKKKPFISTFHSLGLSILRQEINHIGYRKSFSIYDEADQISLIQKVIKDVWPHIIDKINVQLVRAAISSYKDSLIAPEAASKEANTPEKVVNAAIYKEYQRRLKLFNAVDFDDLILLPLALFNRHADVLEKFQDKYKYIMIDEYQDTNYPQFLFTKKIAEKYKNICVVGDDDQSIYGWRGADYRNILEFDRHFPKTKVIKLEQNYRSTKSILTAANHVIKNNTLRRSKNLWSAKKNDKPITLNVFPTARDESESVVKNLLEQKIRYKKKFKDFAILMRTNHQSRLFEEQLRRNRIPYILIGGTRFFDRKEVKDIIAYLKFILNRNDEVSLLRIINTPSRSIGMRTIAVLNEYCKKNKTSFLNALKNADSIKEITPKTKQSIRDFLNIMSFYRKELESERPLTDTIKQFIIDIKYEKEVTRVSDDRKEIESRMNNISELIEDISYYEEQMSGHTSLRQYLNNITLNADDDKSKDNLERDLATIITLHSCKGLEFPYVFMVGMEEGILPHGRSMDENQGDISEERRLCYVGITRAKDELNLSYCLARTKYGELSPGRPSRFLEEIPKNLISSPDDVVTEEEESEIAQFYLEKMKKIVGS